MTKVLMRRGHTSAGPGIRGLERVLEQGRRACPRFSHYWLNLVPPHGGRLLEEYDVQGSKVRIYSRHGGLDLVYHLTPREYTLGPIDLALVSLAADRIRSSPPPGPLLDGEELRQHVRCSAASEIRAEMRRARTPAHQDQSPEDRVSSLAEVVVRYTAGLGLFELLLEDRRLEDVFVDAPCRSNPIHVTLSGLEGRNSVARCTTNISVDEREVRALVARMKFHSGRSFSEASPVMETDVPGFESRATVIGPPLSPMGMALALRRHAPEPWTLMRLVQSGVMDCFTAALISFLVDGRSTMLVCGPRGAGKSSLLAAILFEFPPGQRILAIEDTPELPVRHMQVLGHKVQSLLIQGGSREEQQAKAEDALRVSLRLGESAIVLGEVRGREAQVLYDGMRTGKAGSSVLGTIHGESARSVYDRVVHDMGIAPQAFQATDAVLTLGLVRPGGCQRPVRQLVELSEVRKDAPGEFSPLVELEGGAMVDRLDERSELIGRIARSWGIGHGLALQHIQARAEMRQILLLASRERGAEFLSPSWTLRTNTYFWERAEAGVPLPEIVQGFQALVGGGARR